MKPFFLNSKVHRKQEDPDAPEESMFADREKILIRSGKGGDGHVSFRREKYVPSGGPDGGNGGKGGDVIFVVDKGMDTLFTYKHKYRFSAGDGKEGGKARMTGAGGKDIIIPVPEGTVIRDSASGKVIADMSNGNERQVILRGGDGGRGNMNYATSRMQAPQYAQPGRPAMELEVILELKLVADVGLVGLPNAGKSTFLSRTTNAVPKIADYPFTTIEPYLGVVDFGDGTGFVIADMPGLIEGASDGAGLGHRFLRHIERTRVLLQIVDAAGTEGRDPLDDIRVIREELRKYGGMEEKPLIIAANKVDSIPEGDDILERIRAEYENENCRVFAISAATGEGVKELLRYIYEVLKTAPKAVVFEQEFFPEDVLITEDLPYTIEIKHGKTDEYIVEGPKIEKMLGYTNLESEKGFAYFQRFLHKTGIIDDLKAKGIQEGDTVRMYGHAFEYYEEGDKAEREDLS